MAKFRMEMVNAELQRCIAEIINKDMHNPAVDGKIISVLSVDCSKDLSYAKVMINIYGTEEESQRALKAIQNAQGFIRANLKKKFVLHHYTSLDFRIDKGYVLGNDLISKINKLNINTDEEQ